MATTVTAGVRQITVAVDNPNRDDFGGMYIWMSETSGFTPGPTNLVYNGPDLTVVLTGLSAGITKYLKMALYSQIDPNDYLVSAQYSATPTAPSVAAEDVLAGVIRGSSVVAGTIATKGTKLVAPTATGSTTLTVHDTTDFSASGGTGVIIDPANDRDVFTYTGKTGTTLTGCSGVLRHDVVPGVKEFTVVPLEQLLVIDPIVQELRFYSSVSGGALFEEAFSVGNNTASSGLGGDPAIVTVGTSGSQRLPLLVQSGTGKRSAMAIRANAAGTKNPVIHIIQGAAPIFGTEPTTVIAAAPTGPSVLFVENSDDDSSGYAIWARAKGTNGGGLRAESMGAGIALKLATNGQGSPLRIVGSVEPTLGLAAGCFYYDTATKVLSSHDGTSWGRYLREGAANDFNVSVGSVDPHPVAQGRNTNIVSHSTGASAGFSATRWSNDAVGPQIFLMKSRGTTIGANGILALNDDVGYITFAGNDGTDNVTQAGEILVEVDGTPAANVMPGRMKLRVGTPGGGIADVVTLSSDLSTSLAGDLTVFGAAYMAGSGLRIGSSGSLASVNLRVSRGISGGASSYGVFVEGTVQADATTSGVYFCTVANTVPAFSATLYHYLATKGTFDGIPSSQTAFRVASDVTGAGQNYGFYDARAAGTTHWGIWLQNTKAYFGNQILQPVLAANPASGTTVSLQNDQPKYLNTQTTTKAALTVNMPSTPDDGQAHKFMTRGAITALTVGATGGATVVGAPTTLAANGFFEMVWSATNNAWVRHG